MNIWLMVIDPASASLIIGGISAATSGANMYAQGRMNRKTREWNEKMYNLQRQHALDDVAFQNAYNHPQQQMERLRQAGLNPNLVYGKGAENTGATIRSSSTPSWSPQAPKMDISGVSNSLTQYQNIKLQQVQTDNIAEQTAVAKAQKLNIEAQTAKTLQESATNSFQLGQAQRLSDLVFEKTQLENSMLRQNIDLNIKNYDLSRLRTLQDIKTAVQNIAESNQRIKTQKLQNELIPYQRQKLEKEITQLDKVIDNADKEGQLKQLDIDLRKIGLMPSDPFYIRAMVQGLSKDKWWIEDKIDELSDWKPNGTPSFNEIKQAYEKWKKDKGIK